MKGMGMGTTLDGQPVFDEQELVVTAGSLRRASLERTFCGLDGVLSIDLGARAREVQQTGVLRAAGRAAMRTRVATIMAFIDGRTHVLKTADGREYPNLRMDAFRQTNERSGGPGVVLEYEIAYTQLGD
jgi:hypothetical protein